jgi:cell division protein FtsQ
VQSLEAGETSLAELDAVKPGWVRRLVLPRFLRKPVRMVLKLRPPRYLGLKGMAALFVATLVAGTVLGGHSLTVVGALTAWGGLAIDGVQITGQSETSEVDVLHALAIDDYPSLVTFDVDAARARVEALPWVKQATIKKLYPDTLQVAVTERTPFAIWQHDVVTSLVDGDGRVITDDVGERYSGLPFVAGPGAAAHVQEFVDLVGGVPSLKPLVHAGVLVSERRWNVVLNGGIEIMLPEEDPAGALVAVAALDAQSGLLSKDIAAVDLRSPERLVVRLTDSGIAARDAALKEREKLARKGRENT